METYAAIQSRYRILEEEKPYPRNLAQGKGHMQSHIKRSVTPRTPRTELLNRCHKFMISHASLRICVVSPRGMSSAYFHIILLIAYAQQVRFSFSKLFHILLLRFTSSFCFHCLSTRLLGYTSSHSFSAFPQSFRIEASLYNSHSDSLLSIG